MQLSSNWPRTAAVTVITTVIAFTLVACGDGGDSKSGSSTTPSTSTPSTSTIADSQDAITPYTAQNVSCPSGTPGKGKPAFKFGSKNFTEEFLLGELYTQTLESRGYPVKYQSNIGASEVIDRAFKSHQIDGYPEYMGVTENVIAKKPVSKTPEETYTNAKTFLAQERGAILGKQTPFENTDVLIVKKDFAEKNNLKTISDLAKVGHAADGVTLAAQPPFETRQSGLVGLKSDYGLTGIKFIGVDPSLVYQLLDQGKANVVNAYSTDGQLASGKYVILKDNKTIFPFDYVAPIIRKSVADAEGPEFMQTLDCVSSLLTGKVMQALNGEIQQHGGDPGDVAKEFLTANKVLTK